MDVSLTALSALVGGLGLLLSGPLGPARLPAVDVRNATGLAQPAFAAQVLSSDGEDLGQMMRDGALSTPIDRLPPEFLQAVIAIEDRRFHDHRGLDPIGLMNAALSGLQGRQRGGSTIDQQMAKNVWVGPEISLRRKLTEALLALRARQALGAEGVLRVYLEHAWFGRGVTGAAGSARAWFDRDWDTLSLSEMAYLAGLLAGPGFFDATRQPERAVARRNLVLSAMLREGFISRETADQAMQESLEVAPRRRSRSAGQRWLTTSARQEILAAVQDWSRTGIDARGAEGLIDDAEVTLSLSTAWQEIAQSALTEAVAGLSSQEPLARLDPEQLAELFADLDDLEAGQTGSEALSGHARSLLVGHLPWDSRLTAAVLVSRGSTRRSWMALTASGQVRNVEVDADLEASALPGDVLAVDAPRAGTAGDPMPARGRRLIEGAVVILDPRTGELLASVGGADPDLSEFDRTRALRQPGSAIKTFLWLAALEAGYRLESLVPDFEQDFVTETGAIWRPRNYDRSQSGMVRLIDAYAQSSNLAAAALADALGIHAMAGMAERAGAYPSGMGRSLTAALGTMEVTLLDLTRAHASIANAGVPRDVRSIRDMQIEGIPVISNGIRIGSGQIGQGPIARRDAIEGMLTMMRAVVTRGTAARAFRNHPVEIRGKTGTTQGYRDAWFVGVTPHLAIGIWIGRDDNRSMSARTAGGRAAAPVAAEILRTAHRQGLVRADGRREEPALLPSGSQDEVQGGIILEGLTEGPGVPPAASERVDAPPAEPARPAPDGSGFWGVVGVQESRQERQAPPPPAPSFTVRNRNEDLRLRSW